MQESSDSTQEISGVEYYPLDSPQEGENGNDASSQSQQSPLPAPLLTHFTRNEQWLEDATDDFLVETQGKTKSPIPSLPSRSELLRFSCLG
jgi:hypothetical protein